MNKKSRTRQAVPYAVLLLFIIAVIIMANIGDSKVNNLQYYW